MQHTIEIADDDLFSSPEVCRMARVSFRQVDYWSRQGVIEPEQAAAGSGTQRRFTGAQVRDVAMIGRLRELGVSLEAIEEVLAVLRDQPGRSLLIIAPEFVRAVDPSEVAQAVTDANGAAILVDSHALRLLDAEPAKDCEPRKRPRAQGARPRHAVRTW